VKILVTGGAGFIGSHVADAFVGEGHDVVIVDDLSTGRRQNLNPKARFYEMDIRDPKLDEVFAQEKPDVVDHHAAQMSVRISVQDPLRDADINIRGSLNILENCVKHQVKKVIYISSGGAAYGEPVYLPCDEKHPVNPLCQYGVTKHTMEHYLYLYNQIYGLDYTVLRYPNVYGPRQDPLGEAGVVAIFTLQMLKGEQAIVNGTGEQVRDYVYVADVVSANLIALGNGSGNIYNLGLGVGISVNEIFDRLKAITAYQRERAHGPAKAGETFKIYLDATKARKELGWAAAVPLQEGLERTVEYFRTQELRA